MSIDSFGQTSRRAPGFAKLANKRRVLPFSLMINNIDGFPEAGFTFQRATAPEKIHGWRRSNDFSRLWLTLNVHS